MRLSALSLYKSATGGRFIDSSTRGTGNAFNGGYLAAPMNGVSVEDALMLGHRLVHDAGRGNTGARRSRTLLKQGLQRSDHHFQLSGNNCPDS
jgi:hypothetical protein